MRARFHNNHKHAPSFYQAVLTILINSRADKQTYAQTADALNAAGMNTPTGQVWSESHIKQVLKGLRSHERYPSRIHTALMTFVFNGVFSVKEALVLLQYSREPV